MPSLRNVQLLEEAKQKVDKAIAMFFVEYTGLTHQQLEEARRQLKEVNAEMAVIKNTLMNLALKNLPAGRQVDAKEKLTGQQGVLFSYEDPINTAKILASFIKKYNLPKISFGIFPREAGSRFAGEGTWDIIDEATIIALSKLPTRDVLIAKLLGTLNSPISGLVYVLNGNIQKLALVLKEIEKKKTIN